MSYYEPNEPDTLHGIIKNREKALAARDEQIKRQQAEIASLNELVGLYQPRVALADAQIEQLRQENAQLQSCWACQAKVNEQRQREIEELSKSCDLWRARASTAAQENTKLRKENQRLIRDDAFHIEACAAHQKHIDELERENAALKGLLRETDAYDMHLDHCDVVTGAGPRCTCIYGRVHAAVDEQPADNGE